MYAHNICSVVSGPLTWYSYTSNYKSNQATKLGSTVIEQQQKGLQCTEIKQLTVSHYCQWDKAPGDWGLQAATLCETLLF